MKQYPIVSPEQGSKLLKLMTPGISILHPSCLPLSESNSGSTETGTNPEAPAPPQILSHNRNISSIKLTHLAANLPRTLPIQFTKTMKPNNNSIPKIITGLAATCALGGSALAQSSDALIDKLVEKGILSVKEANQLREDTDKDFNKAYSTKSGMPEWVTSLKFNGDFRGRFEENNAENPVYHPRDRYRYRVRFGATASLVDNFDVALRLASGNPQTNPGGTLVGGSPITANQDLNSLETRKFLWIDAAYARWTPIHNADWTFSSTIGKMDNPFSLSTMIFDADINPEGAALQLARMFGSKHTLKLNSGIFVLDEVNQTASGLGSIAPSHDPYVYGGQLLFESKWSTKFDTSLGVAAFNIASRDALSSKVQPFYNSGNTRDGLTGLLKNNYNPIIATAAATYKLDSFPFYDGAFPLKVSGEYMNNPGAPANNEAYRLGLSIGKAGKRKTWEINYRYQRLEADAWFDAMVDDDNGAFYSTGNKQLIGTGKANGWFGGTNVRGHQMQATYSFTDYLNFTFTYYLNDLIIGTPGQKGAAGHFMADIMWKF